jgi:hypothetical protein
MYDAGPLTQVSHQENLHQLCCGDRVKTMTALALQLRRQFGWWGHLCRRNHLNLLCARRFGGAAFCDQPELLAASVRTAGLFP